MFKYLAVPMIVAAVAVSASANQPLATEGGWFSAGMMEVSQPSDRPVEQAISAGGLEYSLPLSLLAAPGDVDSLDPEPSGVRGLLETEIKFLISPDLDSFRATRSGGGWIRSEEIDGVGSVMPSVRGGIVIETENVDYSVTVGGIGVLNGAFGAAGIVGDFAAHFKVSKKVSLGVHAGPVYFFKPSWFGDGDVDFTSASMGLIGGFSMTIEFNKTLSLRAMVDGVLAEPFNVEGSGGWSVNQDELDISGIAAGAALMVRF